MAESASPTDEPAPVLSLADVFQLYVIATAEPAVRLLPERHWLRVIRPVAWAAARSDPGRRREAVRRIGALFPDGPPAGETPGALHERIAGRMIGEVFMVRRLASRPGWRPPLRVLGAETVEEARARGGVLLWVASQPCAMLLTAVAGHDRGWPLHRLSHWTHGLGRSRLGRRWFNPAWQAVENLFARRIVIGPDGAGPALEAMRGALSGGGIVQVHAVARGRRLARVPVLGGSMRLAFGAVRAGMAEAVPVVGVTLERDGEGTWVLRFSELAAAGEPVALETLGMRLGERIGETLLRDPASWSIYGQQWAPETPEGAEGAASEASAAPPR